jgi:DNA-binding GntR family transcriptional regulator
MEIKNQNEKRVYDYIVNDINTNGKNYSVLTNNQIGAELKMSPITVRDKVIKLTKQNNLVSLLNHFDENNKFFIRKILKGNVPG